MQTSGPSAANAPAPSRVEGYAHVVTLLAFVALFTWLFARFFFRPLYLAESDLYENGLPIFLSPISKWSSFEFSGLPVFADPANFDFYLPNMIFGKLLHSWTAVVMSGPLLVACFTYAYVFSATRSRAAAVFSALAFGLSEDMLERLRHINHVHAIAWLPLIVLALDRVRQPVGARVWVAIGAFAVGSCILAGHPQPALYVMYCAGLYAVVGIGVEAGSKRTRPPLPQFWRNVGATAALFAIGILMSSVKAFPLIEARNIVVRSEGLTFERFVGPSLTGPQMFSFVFPTIQHGPTTELPTYVGLATLLLALIGATRLRSNWRAGFWLAMCFVGVVMGLGTATPLVDAAYYVPLYSWFRNISRHMFLFSFGASVLAGFGMAAFEWRQVSLRSFRAAAAALTVVMVTGAMLIRAFPASFPLEGPHGEPGPGLLSIFTVGVWIQLAILLAIIAVTGTWGRGSFSEGSRRRAAPALLTAILVVDLLSALPYDIKPDGIEIYAISVGATRPSVHALAIARGLEPTHARALAVGGTQLDEVLPATFARAWRIPIAGGYGAMLVDRLSRLANMGTNGEVRPAVLADDDATLDLLAVKYIIVNGDQLTEARARWLLGSDRWSTAMHFRTARDTDRGSDEDVEGETDVTVFENRRALPRAWLAASVLPLAEADAIVSIKSSKLPDGAPFEPGAVALIDPSSVPPSTHFAPGESDVRVTRIGDGDIGVRVSSAGGGFLVLSENAYPGWRARIDGVEVPIYRTDVTLQGVVVRAGTHRVDFTMEPPALEAGILVSGLAGLVCVALLATAPQREGTGRVLIQEDADPARTNS